MIRRSFNSEQVTRFMIERRINAMQLSVNNQLNGVFSGNSNRTFSASVGAFGEYQKSVAVGFTNHYTRRS